MLAKCCCGGCDITSDDFTRADSSSIGAGWREVAGDWSLASNQLTVASSDAFARNLANQPDDEFRIKVCAKGQGDNDGDELRVFVAWSDTRYIFAQLTVGSGGCGELQLFANTAGSIVALGTPMPIPAGTEELHTLEVCYRVTSDPADSYAIAKVTTAGGVMRWIYYAIDITGQTPDSDGITGGVGTGDITTQATFDAYLSYETYGPEEGDSICPDCVIICRQWVDSFSRGTTTDLGCDWEEVSGAWSLTPGFLKADTAGVVKYLIPNLAPPYVRVRVSTYPVGLTRGEWEGQKFRIRVDWDTDYVMCELSYLEYIAIYARGGALLDIKHAPKDWFDPGDFQTYGRFVGPMNVCLGPEGISFSVSGGTLTYPSGIFSPVTTAGGEFVGLETDTDGAMFSDCRVDQVYTDDETTVCVECGTEECECSLCPDDNAPAFFSLDMTTISWKSFCSEYSQVVLTSDCNWEEHRSGIPNYIYTWPAAFGGAPDEYCIWWHGLVAVDVLVFITSRSGTLYLEVVIYENGGGGQRHGSVALSGDCADIDTTVSLSNSVGNGVFCIDGTYGTPSVDVAALLEPP